MFYQFTGENHLSEILKCYTIGTGEDCVELKQDIAAITEWAKIFTQPITLNKVTTENWHLHEREIRANVDKAMSDWSAG